MRPALALPAPWPTGSRQQAQRRQLPGQKFQNPPIDMQFDEICQPVKG